MVPVLSILFNYTFYEIFCQQINGSSRKIHLNFLEKYRVFWDFLLFCPNLELGDLLPDFPGGVNIHQQNFQKISQEPDFPLLRPGKKPSDPVFAFGVVPPVGHREIVPLRQTVFSPVIQDEHALIPDFSGRLRFSAGNHRSQLVAANEV